MKIITRAAFAVSSALAALGGAAQAADAPAQNTAAKPLPAFVWSGFYAGLNTGASWANTRRAGFAGGAQIGFNRQMDMLVAGAEADFSALTARRASQTLTPAGLAASQRTNQTWLGTARARLGITPADRLLVFATGGLAVGDVKTRARIFDPATGSLWQASRSEVKAGWTLGAGAEFAVSSNVTFKGEYLYYDLGDTRAARSAPVPPPAAPALRADARGSVVRAGMNLKF